MMHLARRRKFKERAAYYSRWVLGIQRRTVYLVPPSSADLEWMFEQFRNPEISEMFGYRNLGAATMIRRYHSGTLVVATIKLVSTCGRIGFLVMYPPARFDFWEFGYAIPDPAHRNAFHALNTTDAVGHYMFEHLGATLCGWRTREDNQAASAVVRRLGYVPGEDIKEEGHRYTIYRLSKEGWKKRREKLERGEQTVQTKSPLFFTLPPPYEPVLQLS